MRTTIVFPCFIDAARVNCGRMQAKALLPSWRSEHGSAPKALGIYVIIHNAVDSTIIHCNLQLD